MLLSTVALIQRDMPGYAIGGLSGGEEKDVFWRMVSICTDMLPTDKPRYLMGVGYGLAAVQSYGLISYSAILPDSLWTLWYAVL